VTISLSPRNPDAVAVMGAIRDIPARQRSAELLKWAAAYLAGEQREALAGNTPDFDEDAVDAALDDW
jgi:hypothetical protein